ncbi:MAG: succinate dehydrogenase, hydrophobic membrane anchor protein [Chromatiales bacterium]|nr:succinate dehydrogenase, hydrophobic membrane anchor protein [Chromatiales bacterium]
MMGSGITPWLLQRLSSVYLGLYGSCIAICWMGRPAPDHAAWTAWVGQPWVSLGMGLFVLALLLHLWVGLRSLLMDWVTRTAVRAALNGLLLIGLTGVGLWALRTLWRAGL